MMCKRIFAYQTQSEGEIPFFKIGTIGSSPDAYISQELFDDYKEKYNYPRVNEVMITCAGTVGRCWQFDGTPSYYQDSNIVWIDNPQGKISNNFIYRILERTDWSKLNSTTITRIYNDNLRNLNCYYPAIEEQNKITDFLSLIDKRIEKQRQLVENLKKYKRGLISNIFEQKIKLGNKGNWIEIKLSKILKERKTYCEKDGTYEHATLSKDGVSAKTERYERDFLVSDENKKYKITKFGDICYNPANLKFGVICLNNYGDAIFSPIYITFEIDENYNKEFIGYCLTRNDFINKALKYQQGTVYERMAVSPEDLLSMEIIVPKKETQNKISALLNILESKLDAESNKLTLLVKMKSSLLQQMFI